MPLSRAWPHLDVGDRLGAGRSGDSTTRRSAPISRENVEQAGARRIDADVGELSVPAPIEPATMKNAADEKSPGTSSEHASSRCGAVRRLAVRRVDAAPEAQQHALGVIARDGRLDHGRPTLRVQAGEQHGRFHLRARDRQLRSEFL